MEPGGRVGLALTVGGLVTVLVQTPAGAIVDQVRAKRAVLIAGVTVLAGAAMLLFLSVAPVAGVCVAGADWGGGAFPYADAWADHAGAGGAADVRLAVWKKPAVQLGGERVCGVADRGVSHVFGNRAIFLVAAALTAPTVVAVRLIRGDEIDYDRARGGKQAERKEGEGSTFAMLAGLPGAADVPSVRVSISLGERGDAAAVGEMLSKGSASSAAPLMSGVHHRDAGGDYVLGGVCGAFCEQGGAEPLLLVGFGVLPVRGLLYTLTHRTGALIAIQVLDGVANAIFGVVAVLVAADRTRGTGRFNLVQGALATAVGIGAALSTTVGGKLIQYFSYRVSFLTLGGIAVAAFGLVLVGLPETREG